jgi:erythronate-4-phosphate dehydrogenase
LAQLGKEQILMNTSRGEVVETAALKERLQKGGLAGVVLDVFENEPEIDRELMSQANISTPHIAGYSADGKANGTAMSVQALSQFFSLPLTDWYPQNVPLPQERRIEIENKGRTPEEVVHAVVAETYEIMADDRRLKGSPESFERQRAQYPLRREFPVYTFSLRHAEPEAESLVRKMGFQVVNP